MNQTPRSLAPLALVLAAVAAAPWIAGAGASAPPAGELPDWTQSRGAADGSCHAAVEGLVGAAEAWRLDFDEVLSDAVAWQGVTYVVVKDKSAKLVAVESSTGRLLDETKVSKTDHADLVVWDGVVGVAGAKGIDTFSLTEDGFDKGKKIKGPFSGAPALHEGVVVFNDEKRKLWAYDLATGKKLAQGKGGYGTPAVVPGKQAGSLFVGTVDYGSRTGYRGTHLILRTAVLSGLGEKKQEWIDEAEDYVGTFDDGDVPKGQSLAGAQAIRFEKGWAFYLPNALASQSGETFNGMLRRDGATGGSVFSLAHPMALVGEELYGFGRDGNVKQMGTVRGGGDLRAKDFVPEGTRPGPATAANGTLHLGNWVLSLKSNEDLAVVEDLAEGRRIVPVGDKRVVYGTAEGDLVCLADPLLITDPVEAGAVAVNAESYFTAERPAGRNGLVTRRGRWMPGYVALLSTDGACRLEPEEGASITFEPGDVAMIVTGDDVEVFGPQYAIYLAWKDALAGEAAVAMEAAFDAYLEARLFSDCKRVVTDAERLAYPGTWVRSLQARLEDAERRAGSPKDGERTKIGEAELTARRAMALEFFAAAEWCRSYELPLAATGLLSRANKLVAGIDEVMAMGRELMPPAFPRLIPKGDPLSKWFEWSEHLLPADGEFIVPEDPFWQELKGNSWWAYEQKVLGFRTKNLLFLTRDPDPELIGLCLRNGEAAVRALHELLPPTRAGLSEEELAERLQVRVHATKEDYHSEQLPGGGYAMSWSAGIFSADEGVSRFYVDGGGASLTGFDRPLHKTMAHELTHHYIHQRWAGGKSGGGYQAGYWCVEGFASFVGDQVVAVGDGEPRFDNPRVQSVETTAACLGQEAVFPAKQHIDRTNDEFHQLSTENAITVHVPSTGALVPLSQLSVFYEQSATLTYFLMNECGDDVRQKTIEYLWDYYDNNSGYEGWKRLGFASAEELDEKFRAFLARIAG